MLEMKGEECLKCAFESHSFTISMGDIDTASLFVCLEYPEKRDGRIGKPLTGADGDILRGALKRFVRKDEVFFTSAIRCFPNREKTTTPIANKCWKQFGAEKYDAFKGDKVLCCGYWAVRMLTGRELNEVHGKVVEKGGRRFACIEHPAKYVRKYIRWERDGKTFKPKPGTLEKAQHKFNAIEGPIISQLFGEYSNIRMDVKPTLPFIRISSEDQMVNILDRYQGQVCLHDYETANKSGYDGPGKRTALDWFYGAQYCDPLCVGYTFFQNIDETGYVEGNHDLSYDEEKVVVYTGPVTERVANAQGGTKLMAFNSNYDTGVTLVQTGVYNDIWADPMDAAYVCNQGRKRYNLESLAYEWVPELASWSGTIKRKGKKVGGANYATLHKPTLWEYCAGDCMVSIILFWKCLFKIYQEQQEFLFWNIMMGTKGILRDMETRGLYVNQTVLPGIQEQFSIDLVRCEDALLKTPEVQWLLKVKGVPQWKPKSAPQVKLIYDEYLDAGLENTQKETLKAFIAEGKFFDHPFTKLLLEHRVVSKLNSTYVTGLLEKMDTERNLVFASFKTNTTITGRSSSGGSDAVGLGKTNQINIQNIPRGSHLRTIYRARPGHYLAYADYSQIEVRVAGAYADSTEIYEVCISDSDFHGMMAAKAFQKDYDWIMAEDKAVDDAGGGTSFRTKSKAITFGLLYGMTPEGLAKRLKLFTENGELDTELAQKFIDDYFRGMPSVKAFIEETHAFVNKNYFVKTVFGRMRDFQWVSAAALRESVNTLVQATASDIFMLGLQATKRSLQQHKIVIKETSGELDLVTAGGTPIGRVIRKKVPYYRNVVHPWAEVHDSMTWEVHNRVPKEEMEHIMKQTMLTDVRTMFPQVDEFLGRIPLHVDFKTTVEWV